LLVGAGLLKKIDGNLTLDWNKIRSFIDSAGVL
jgi:hypothetical protein